MVAAPACDQYGVAVRARRWEADWDVPRLDFGRPITPAEIDDTVRQAMSDKK